MMENAEGCFRHVARCRRLGEPFWTGGEKEKLRRRDLARVRPRKKHRQLLPLPAPLPPPRAQATVLTRCVAMRVCKVACSRAIGRF